jgi:bifunctional non-homologous end joining protein LigD
LEKDGVLKSWAVPKGLPEKSGIRRLAIQVEDHELDYINFHGVIPEGYGAGKVEIEDKGTYESVEYGKEKISFVLKGKKFIGGYTLYRIKDKQWLVNKWKDN